MEEGVHLAGCRLSGRIPSAGVPRSGCRTPPPISVGGGGSSAANNMVCGLFVLCSFCVSQCMLTVSNALLMSSAIVRYAGLDRVKTVVMVLLNCVFVEWLLLKSCCLEKCGILPVM